MKGWKEIGFIRMNGWYSKETPGSIVHFVFYLLADYICLKSGHLLDVVWKDKHKQSKWDHNIFMSRYLTQNATLTSFNVNDLLDLALFFFFFFFPFFTFLYNDPSSKMLQLIK